jgi:peptidoglycan/LPS O-acetylase OafA/YrhL
MRFGHFAVNFFIVISGFCLMLPVARSADGKLRGGFKSYILRRARRILPPYYAALAVAVIFDLLKHSQVRNGVTVPSVLAHAALLGNATRGWVGAINPALWSVATEWQIYFLFPLILLPLWRRSGIALAVAAALLIGIAPHWLVPASHNFEWTFPWMLGMFALGMVAALLVASPRPDHRILRDSIPWSAIAVGFFAIFAVAVTLDRPFVYRELWAFDSLFGIGAMACIIACARRTMRKSEPGRIGPVAILESAPLRLLGAFSYSLYLMHLPAWWLLLPVVKALHLTGAHKFAFQLIVAVPFCIVVSYAFYLLVERRCSAAVPGHGRVALRSIFNWRLAPSQV